MKTSELKNLVKECVRVIVSESKDKKWIQKAVKKSHRGYCTPMTKATCTPKRKALAMRFKKGDIHKDNVGESQGGMSVPHDYAADNQKMRRMEEVAPPGFGKGKSHGHLYDKLLKQYKGDPSKAYATMWSIYDKMEEAANAAMNECGLTSEAGLTSEDAKDTAINSDEISSDEQGMKEPGEGEEMTTEEVLKEVLNILDGLETLPPEKAITVLSIVKKIIEVLVKPDEEEPTEPEEPADGEPLVEPDTEPPQKV